ncbi:MAG: hypothetical protein RLZZ11_1160, partial [Cyanobacteriota bacterium]
ILLTRMIRATSTSTVDITPNGEVVASEALAAKAVVGAATACREASNRCWSEASGRAISC